jgi:hypothetical protein
MKYALLSSHKFINRISDTEPQSIAERATVEQITDDQAAQVEAGRTSTPPVRYFLIGGTLLTMQQKMEADRAARLAERAASMTPEQKIAAGEQYVINSGITGFRLGALQDRLLTAKEAGTLASKPKLVALYTWLQTVKAMAIAGSVSFPPAPHTFEEVVSE